MCGIAGWVDWTRDITSEREIMGSMVSSLAHRGPDAEGMCFFPNAALGHRRLIVVDPEGGRQPMTRSYWGNRYTITYNGELYNTLEIRRELENRGYHFQTRSSDTEVLLTAYIEWGTECVKKLNGIFAFGIWDEDEQILFLARDRLGVKPLFYYHQDGFLLFASEPKAILAHPAVKAVVNAEGLAEIFVMGPSRTPGHGIFRGLKELRGGYLLLYNRIGIYERKYWSLMSCPHEDDLETTALKVRELLQDSVSRQMVADVPVCAFLSGGLDSSIITAFASGVLKAAGQHLHTFSVDYADNTKYYEPNQFETGSDRYWVSRVSKQLGTVHHYVTVDNVELAESLLSSLIANDFPGMADIDSSLYLFCREIKKRATVALSGECADEIFGGYPWFNDDKDLSKSGFPWIRMLREREKFLNPEVVRCIKPCDYAAERYREAVSEVPRLEGEEGFDAEMREMFYLNITRFMPTLLDRKDRMSMACGLEVRVPFSDHRLVEYVWNIPAAIKFCNNTAKGILRYAVKGILPDDVLLRPKNPYPKTHNPIYFQVVKEEFAQVLNDPSSPILPLVDAEKLRCFIKDQEKLFRKPWFGQLMGDAQYLAYLLQVNYWLKKYNVSIRL